MAQKDENEKQVHSILFKIVNLIPDKFIERMPMLIKQFFSEAEKQAPKPKGEGWDKWADNLVKSGFVDQDTADLIKGVKEYNFPLNVVAYAVVPLMIMLRDMSASLEIYGLDRQYHAQALTTPHPAPVDNLVRSMIMDPARSNENRAELKKHGFSDKQINNIILSYYTATDVNTVRIQFLRGIIDEERMYERMRELGYTDTRTAEIVETWKVLPSAQDLFTMVAHEAFEPDMYTKLGLDAEFPTEQVKWLEQQGISVEWAKKAWIAHWEQPSILQGFEMLHRGVIDYSTLDLLFRAVEIPSFWRDKLTQIAYNPYTRVDVRRMHDLGVIDDEGLVKAYKDLGYDDEKAGKMAEFTIKYNEDADKQLTKSTILDSYGERIISRGDALALLMDQGYSKEVANFYLAHEDYKVTKDLVNAKIGYIHDRFIMNMITLDDSRRELNLLGLRGEKIDVLLEIWQLETYQYEKIPTKSELDRFFSKGLITEGAYRNFMKRHGIPDYLVDIYVADLGPEPTGLDHLPTKADLKRWYTKKIITLEQWTAYMGQMGYSPALIGYYLKDMQ